jgi:hypothetical protein
MQFCIRNGSSYTEQRSGCRLSPPQPSSLENVLAGRTPLHKALYQGTFAVAALLLRAGATADVTDPKVGYPQLRAAAATRALALSNSPTPAASPVRRWTRSANTLQLDDAWHGPLPCP